MYHEGEKEIQKRTGEEKKAHATGRVISNQIIKGAIPFIEKQQFMIAASVDDLSQIWVSLIMGESGFISVPSPQGLHLKKDLIYSDQKDLFFDNINTNHQIGLLFIELATRRRFRVNGIISHLNDSLKIRVQEAYPNCPKYIQKRVFSPTNSSIRRLSVKTQGSELTNDLMYWIRNSDTVFVGSQGINGWLDASHRGGNSGFIEVLKNNRLRMPDYQGNSMYNTLGNLIQNPKVGLLFIDFKKGRILQLTGEATLFFDQDSDQDLLKTGGTGRYWCVNILKWIITENHHQVKWEFMEYSPFNPQSK